jgi:hypothetical protein
VKSADGPREGHCDLLESGVSRMKAGLTTAEEILR